jgi:hypothetical protein
MMVGYYYAKKFFLISAFLPQSFSKITRSTGKEENRNELLESITNSKNTKILREIDNNEFWARNSFA